MHLTPVFSFPSDDPAYDVKFIGKTFLDKSFCRSHICHQSLEQMQILIHDADSNHIANAFSIYYFALEIPQLMPQPK